MKKYLSLIFLLFPIVQVWPQEKKEVIVLEKSIILKATEPWINAGISLFPSDKVHIKATGTICFSDGHKDSTVDPEGWDVENYSVTWLQDASYCDDPLIDQNHAGLIGNVGDKTFFIGKEHRLTGMNGTLYLGINDCTFAGPYFNTGKFEVYIKVEHIKE